MKRLVAIMSVLTACGGGAATTPEAALQKLLDAARDNNGADFREAFPSREELAARFDCAPELLASYDGLSDEFVAMRSVHAVIAPGSLSSGKAQTIAAGAEVGGCKARRAINVLRADVHLHDTTLAMRFVQIDDTWRVLGF